MLVILGAMYVIACEGHVFKHGVQEEKKIEKDGRSEESVEYEGDICEAIKNVTIERNKIEIKKEVIRIDEEIDKRYIEYPYLDSDKHIAQQINDQIYELIDREGLWDSEYAIHEEITYEVMYCDDRILSILFMGYRSVIDSYADFDMALNFDINSGEILTLQSFYTLPEISQLVQEALAENKLLVANIPLKEDDMQIYMDQYFKKVLSDDSYITRNDNSFITKGNLYLLQKVIHLCVKIFI